MKKTILLSYFMACVYCFSFSQNIGIGTTTPSAKLHIKGSTDTSQLVIDANSIQGNAQPLIKLRTSNGIELLHIHSDDTSNTFIGLNTGRINNALLNGLNNTFTGSYAGYSNTTGTSNTATGANALRLNSTGYNNTATGRDALYFNTLGRDNSAYGSNTLRLNSSGDHNTAAGVHALYNNSNGNFNTAVGYNVLNNNTTGNFNTAIGLSTLISNTTGSFNTAGGYSALFENNGSSNTSIGTNSLYNNSTGIYNTATGYNALNGNTTGNYNTANGMEALYKNPAGNGNTANGFQAIYFFNGNTGDQNTAIGSYALTNALTSSYNTAFGSGAGSGAIFYMGWNNTLIGAQTKANAAGIFNTIALGESALSSANNQARIGNSFITSIGGYVGWSNISDGRVKKNISENVPGLAFINMLKPLTYNLDLEVVDRIIQRPAKKDKDGNIIMAIPFETAARKQKEQIVYTGFIAQEVEKAAKELSYDFSGVDVAKNDNDLYGLRYAEFVVPLVKAAQQLSKQKDDLIKQNEDLLKRMEKLESLLLIKK